MKENDQSEKLKLIVSNIACLNNKVGNNRLINLVNKLRSDLADIKDKLQNNLQLAAFKSIASVIDDRIFQLIKTNQFYELKNIVKFIAETATKFTDVHHIDALKVMCLYSEMGAYIKPEFIEVKELLNFISHEALKYTNDYQVLALSAINSKTNGYLMELIKTNQIYKYENTFKLICQTALKVTDIHHINALYITLSEPVINSYLELMRFGDRESLKEFFNSLSEGILSFTNDYQVNALRILGASKSELALEFTTEYQLEALKTLGKEQAELALEFTTEYQLEALKILGKEQAELALEFEDHFDLSVFNVINDIFVDHTFNCSINTTSQVESVEEKAKAVEARANNVIEQTHAAYEKAEDVKANAVEEQAKAVEARAETAYKKAEAVAMEYNGFLITIKSFDTANEVEEIKQENSKFEESNYLPGDHIDINHANDNLI